MMTKRVLMFVALSAAMLMHSCDNATLREKIERKEKQLMEVDENKATEEIAKSLIADYLEFASKHPQDTLTPQYRFRAADMMMNRNLPVKALKQLDIVMNQYPGFNKVADALFLKGYILENNLGELGRAKEVYDQFLEQYPKHAFADDVKVSLEYLGRSPEDLVRMFEKREENKRQVENSSER
jgi:outer membrane protein assembly factor BamD (BamD/ComL family)